MVDHPLGPATGARGVVQRQGIPFAVRQAPFAIVFPAFQEFVPGPLAEPLAGALGQLGLVVVDVDHGRWIVEPRQGLFNHRRKLGIGDQHPGIAVLEDIGHRVRIQPGVDGIEYTAGHGHREMGLGQFRGIGRHHRHRGALADPDAFQGVGHATAAGGGFPPGPGLVAVDDGGDVRIDICRALEEGNGAQFDVVEAVDTLELVIVF